jgi:hypothetical protein
VKKVKILRSQCCFCTDLHNHCTTWNDLELFGTKTEQFGTKTEQFGTKMKLFGTKMKLFRTKMELFGTKAMLFWTKIAQKRPFSSVLALKMQILSDFDLQSLDYTPF